MKYIRILITLFLLMACQQKQIKTTNNSYATRSISQSMNYAESSDAVVKIQKNEHLTFEKLKKIAWSESVGTVSELLEKLSKKYPSYLALHTYLYKSQSLQDATYSDPRVIVFGPNADFVFTFNGNKDQRGGATIETMEFSRSDQKFYFREICFKSERKNRQKCLSKEDIEFENDRLTISKPNIEKCSECHSEFFMGGDHTPIFGQYFIWPGMYGSNDDNLTTSSLNVDLIKGVVLDAQVKQPQSLLRNFSLQNPSADLERINFQKFLENKNSHSRYKWLGERLSDAGSKAFNENRNLTDDEIRKINYDFHQSYAWPLRPNLYLDTQLNRLSMESLVAELNRRGLKNIFRGAKINFAYIGDGTSTEALEKIVLQYSNFLASIPFVRQRPSRAELRKELILQLQKSFKLKKRLVESHLADFPIKAIVPMTLQMDGLGSEHGKNLLTLAGGDYSSAIDRTALDGGLGSVMEYTLLSVILRDRGITLQKYSVRGLDGSLSFSHPDPDPRTNPMFIFQYIGIETGY